VKKAAETALKIQQELTPKLQTLEKLDQQIKKAQSDLAETYRSARPYEKAVAERDYWVRLINHVHGCLPQKYVWITSWEIQEAEPVKGARGTLPGETQRFGATPALPQTPTTANQTPPTPALPKLIVKGLYLENPAGARVVHDFGEKLRNPNPFFEVPESDKWEIINKANPSEWAQAFTIPLTLNDYPGRSLEITP
jgi:hypothetical protein